MVLSFLSFFLTFFLSFFLWFLTECCVIFKKRYDTTAKHFVTILVIYHLAEVFFEREGKGGKGGASIKTVK